MSELSHEERVQIFSERVLRWGWQCMECGDEDSHYGNATTAREGGDNHAAACPAGSRMCHHGPNCLEAHNSEETSDG